MGRTTTPTYRVEMYVPGFHMTPAAWNVKRDGRPHSGSLAAYVVAFEKSTDPFGVNHHLGAQTVERARIIHQPSGDVVARYGRDS